MNSVLFSWGRTFPWGLDGGPSASQAVGFPTAKCFSPRPRGSLPRSVLLQTARAAAGPHLQGKLSKTLGPHWEGLSQGAGTCGAPG